MTVPVKRRTALAAVLAAAAALVLGAAPAAAGSTPAGCTPSPAAPAAGEQFTVAFDVGGAVFNVQVTDTDGTLYSSDLYNYAGGQLTAGWDAAASGTVTFTVTRVPSGVVAGYCQVTVT
jgi:hypothetical protein